MSSTQPIGAGRLVLFSLVSTVAYTVAYYGNWALFRFYPETGTFEWLRPPHGIAISWYGWIVTAALAGLVVAGLAPRSVAQRIPPDAAWVVPLMVIAATLVYEKRWFF